MSVGMISKDETSKLKWKDIILWFLVTTVVFSGSYTMFYFREQIVAFRLLFTFLGLACALGIASLTSQGLFVIKFSQSAWGEMQKVVWPKPDEAKQISLLVLVSIVLITLAIWLVDSILTVMVRNLLG